MKGQSIDRVVSLPSDTNLAASVSVRRLCIALVLSAGLFSACGDGSDDAATPTVTPTVAPTATPTSVRPGPGAAEGVIALEPISGDEYATLAERAGSLSNHTGCQGNPSSGSIQVCQIVDSSTNPVTWIAIAASAGANQSINSAEVAMFYGNDAVGGIAVGDTSSTPSDGVTGYWKATWVMPDVAFQLNTDTYLVAAFMIANVGERLDVMCSRSFSETTYTCEIVHL